MVIAALPILNSDGGAGDEADGEPSRCDLHRSAGNSSHPAGPDRLSEAGPGAHDGRRGCAARRRHHACAVGEWLATGLIPASSSDGTAGTASDSARSHCYWSAPK
jgi:hypothetical protein